VNENQARGGVIRVLDRTGRITSWLSPEGELGVVAYGEGAWVRPSPTEMRAFAARALEVATPLEAACLEPSRLTGPVGHAR
jgi:hypothetical protein